MGFRFRFFIALLALLIVQISAVAQTDYPDWDPPEIIDTGIDASPGSAGFSIAEVDDGWWVAYEKNSDIYVAHHTNSGWGTPMQVTSDPTLQMKPRLASSGSRLSLVWEDHRGVHPEIFYRYYDGTNWTPEVEISGDGVPSRAPAICAGYVVWEDSTDTVFKVMGRFFSGTVFEEPELLSSPISSAREPDVSPSGESYGLTVVWTDFRTLDPQIYSRSYEQWSDEWDPESRVTDLLRPYGNPTVTVEPSGDVPFMTTARLRFEGTLPSGVVEVFHEAWNGIQMISPDDSVSSVRPNIAGFNFPIDNCGVLPSSGARTYTTWTDLDPSGSRYHTVGGEDPVEGLTVSSIGAVRGEPLAEIAQIWIGGQSNDPVLMARIGRVPGCTIDAVEGFQPLIVAPGGYPANRVRAFDSCSGEPLEWYPLTMFVGASGIRWDPEQDFQLEENTNEDGDAFFSLRGGGCTNQGTSRVECSGWMGYPSYDWTGAKSPDRNANCIVDLDDLAYVEDRLGTDDYCADLDGSGWVTEEDLAIVEMTLWDHCSDVVGIDDLIEGIEPTVFIHPNPARATVRIRTALPAGSPGELRIIAPSGRLVRAIDLLFGGRQTQTTTWDLRNEAGRKVSPGIYFAVLRSVQTGRTIARPILVVQ